MSNEPSEAVLRRSLDAIDAIRRRMMWVGVGVVLGTLAAFFWFHQIVRTSSDVKVVLEAAVLALTCVIAWSTFALAVFITRMTKRIVRAIDLAANR